jgi:hypothetical protein
MKVRFDGGVKDVPLSEVTADNYIVPQGEERHWHVIQEKKEFDRNTGKRLSRPVLQKYDTKAYPATRNYLIQAGYTITVLHDPEKWKQGVAQAAQRKAEADAKAKAKKIADQRKAEREALKAELRKELLAELAKETKQGKKNTTKK